jgi:predicted permease
LTFVVSSGGNVETILKDVRYAVRNLLNTRGFTAIAILTLALGISVNTAMFSVVNAVLLRPLPFRDPQKLMAIGEFDTRRGATVELASVSYPDFADIRKRSRCFEDVAAYGHNEYTLTGVGPALHVNVESVSTNMFRLLGIRPSLGRDFVDSEDEPGQHVVILSDAFWRERFHDDPNAVGRSFGLNGRTFTVVGVMPHGFQYPVRADALDMWITFSRSAERDDPTDDPMTTQRGAHWLGVVARLKPGISVEQMNADLGAVAHALSSEYPKSNTHMGAAGKAELEELVGDTRTPLRVLLGAVGLVLLIACANIANLLLARSSGRTREIAIRAALGATRMRIVRQLVTESLVLAITGATLGVVVASWALRGVLHLYPQNLPRAQEVSIDYRVLLFTIGLSIVTGILFGLVPALQTSKPNLTGAMREGERTTTVGSGRSRLRSTLVIAETALGVMLLIGAGLLIRSLQKLSQVDLGFNPGHLLTANFDLSETRYNSDQQDRFVTDLMARLKNLPGVAQVAGAIPLPLSNNHIRTSFNVLDHPVSEGNEPTAQFAAVTPGFFETAQIPLVHGRTFDARDQRNAPPVMIVSREFARRYFPNEDPLGRKVKIGASEGPSRESYRTREIIGIVGDVRTNDLMAVPRATYYVPLPQLMFGAPTLLVRTAGETTAVTAEIRKVLAAMDPDAPLYEVRTMEDYLALGLGRAKFQATLLAVFACLALLLTAVGLYGVMAYTVAQRTHEIGVRMALGASREAVLRMVLHKGVILTVTGILVGVAGALALATVIQSLLYQIPPRDPMTYAAVCVTLGTVALLASYIPALRATRVDPMFALRHE